MTLFERLLTPFKLAPITGEPNSNLSLRDGSLARGKSAAVVYAVKDTLTLPVLMLLNSAGGREMDMLPSVVCSPRLGMNIIPELRASFIPT